VGSRIGTNLAQIPPKPTSIYPKYFKKISAHVPIGDKLKYNCASR
jgi:hypothetical protein